MKGKREGKINRGKEREEGEVKLTREESRSCSLGRLEMSLQLRVFATS